MQFDEATVEKVARAIVRERPWLDDSGTDWKRYAESATDFLAMAEAAGLLKAETEKKPAAAAMDAATPSKGLEQLRNMQNLGNDWAVEQNKQYGQYPTIEAERATFRDALAKKDEEIARLKQEVKKLETDIVMSDRLRSAAWAIHKRSERTLRHLGYTDEGGEMWEPPLGKAPEFDKLNELRTWVSVKGFANSPSERGIEYACRRVREIMGWDK